MTARGTPFSPLNISGLRLWFRADSLVLNDADPVGTWSDESGNATNATQATAGLKPLYKTNIINGLPVVRWDDTNDQLLTTSLALSQPYTIFLVQKTNSLATSNRVFATNPAAGGVFLSLFDSDGTNDGKLSMNAGISVFGGSNYVGAFHFLTGVFNGASSNGWVDGTQVITTQNAGANTIAEVSLGCSYSGLNTLNGDIAEVLLYTSALATIDRLKVEGYLKAKYAL